MCIRDSDYKLVVVLFEQKKYVAFYSSVAQLVEQLTVNQLVAGSSPARGAKFYPTFEILFETCNDLLNFNF